MGCRRKDRKDRKDKGRQLATMLPQRRVRSWRLHFGILGCPTVSQSWTVWRFSCRKWTSGPLLKCMYTKFSNLNFRWFSPYSLATSSKLIKGRRLVSCLSKSVLSHLVIQIIPNLNIIQSTAYMWNYDESWGYIYMVQSPIYHSASDLSGYPWPSLGVGFPPGADAAGCVGRAGERGTLLSHLFRQLRVQGGANGNEAVGVDCETKYGSGNQKKGRVCAVN